MKKNCFIFLLSVPFLLSGAVYGQSTPTPTATDSDASFEAEKHKLELERLRLENEKLQLEMKQVQSENDLTESKKKKENEKQDQAVYQTDESKKAADLAQQNKDKADLLVLDLVNAEVWYKGVRYSVHDFYTLGTDQNWKMTKKGRRKGIPTVIRGGFIGTKISRSSSMRIKTGGY